MAEFTKQELIKKFKEFIEYNKELIEEINFMCGTDWTRHRSNMEAAKMENVLYSKSIKIMEEDEKELEYFREQMRKINN